LRSDTEPPSAEPLESQLYALPVIESWSNIEVERGTAVWTETFAGVEIDNITDAVAAPVNHPIVSVKWGCVSGSASEMQCEVMRIGE